MYPGFLSAPGSAKTSEPYNIYTNRRWPIGTLLITQDGRWFRFAHNGGTLAVAGSVYQSEVPGANFDELAVAAAVAAGSRTVTVTNGATTVAENDFAGGYLNIEDDAGEGRTYWIHSNTAAGNAETITLTLNTGIELALTTSTTVTLVKHPYMDVIVHPSPPTAMVVGVAVSPIAADGYGWLQTKGPASVLTEGTLVIAQPVRASESANGAVTVVDFDEAATDLPILGVCMEVAATTEHSIVNLHIE